MGLYLIADSSPILATTLGYIWVTLKVLIGLGLVIFVHELGHFLVAKACGVKCEKFYLGFDVPIRLGPIALPRTLGKFQWGETEYGVGIIPLGGYVKMLGQDDNPANAQQEAERIRVKPNMAEGDAGQAGHLSPDAQAAAGDEEQFELDPRSFPAKSVPQRMAIISAGVIMNLIFAVIFAAIAYHMGVKHEPCEIGGTSPGSPAWTQNLPIGSKIIQIGKSSVESDHLRFVWDLKQYVAHAGIGEEPQPIDFKLRKPDGEEAWVSVVPDDRLVKTGVASFATIGIRPTDCTTLSSKMPAIPHMSGGRASPALAAGDRIIGVDGQQFQGENANWQNELPANDVETALAEHIDQPLKLLVQRAAEESQAPVTVEVTVPPNQMYRIGLGLQIGPLQAIREDSPAASAGFQVGDVITHVDGKPIGDPVLLSQQFRRWIGKEVVVSVRRSVDGNAASVDIATTPEPRFQFIPNFGESSLVAIESLGVSYAITNTVTSVEPGSPAEGAGFQPGDVLTVAQFMAKDEETKDLAEKLFGRSFDAEIAFNQDRLNWPYVSDLMQKMPPEVRLQLNFNRGDEKLTAELKPVASEEWFYADRGLRMLALDRVHTASTWGESWRLGYRETKEKLLQVLNVLGKLVTFQLSPKNLGGPLMIAAVAGSEASQGIPRLLLFLTFLSANLAILNFLPIPALDGGHMVFLAAEAVTGKPVDERLQGTLTLIGVVCLLGLMVFVFANDIGRLFL